MFELSLTIAPSGRWIFVGRVPAELAIETDDPSLIETTKHVGPGMAKAIARKRGATYRELSWDSSEAALQYAKARGYTLPAWEPRR